VYLLHDNKIMSVSTTVVYQHWPETCEFITQTIELWDRWIRLSSYYNRV